MGKFRIQRNGKFRIQRIGKTKKKKVKTKTSGDLDNGDLDKLESLQCVLEDIFYGKKDSGQSDKVRQRHSRTRKDLRELTELLGKELLELLGKELLGKELLGKEDLRPTGKKKNKTGKKINKTAKLILSCVNDKLTADNKKKKLTADNIQVENLKRKLERLEAKAMADKMKLMKEIKKLMADKMKLMEENKKHMEEKMKLMEASQLPAGAHLVRDRGAGRGSVKSSFSLFNSTRQQPSSAGE